MARGTFKQRRGGGRNFSKNLILDENGTAVAKDKWAARDREEDDDDDDDEEEEQEESEEEEESGDDAALKPVQAELSRAERKEMKKKKAQAAQAKKQANSDGEDEEEEEDEDPVLVNPNHSVGKRMNLADLGAPRELSRKEKEEKEKKEAKERYWKLHAAGKTDEAKADLARLAKIRAEREAAQAKRKAEAQAKAAEAEQKRKEQMAKKRT